VKHWRVHIFLTERAHLSRSNSTPPATLPLTFAFYFPPQNEIKARAKCFDNLKTHWARWFEKCPKKNSPIPKKNPPLQLIRDIRA